MDSTDIDFVVSWVDGCDPEWRKQKAMYSGEEIASSVSNGEECYRDWGIMHFWFRAVEKYAPWVRRVYFITCGHVPEWLNLNHSKLNFVKHEDYIPGKWLPTFSAHVIEINLHRIPGLAEKFVYFNDDMFLNAPVRPEDFFRDGLPCATAVLSVPPVRWKRHGQGNVVLNNIQAINEHFDFRSRFRSDLFKWISPRYGIKNVIRTLMLATFHMYTGFMELHTANSYLKATFNDVWNAESVWLAETSARRFRDRSDASQWLMEYWQLATGKFYPRSPEFSKLYGGGRLATAAEDIRTQAHKVICINDNAAIDSQKFVEVSEAVKLAYSEALPEKSSFEL